MKITLDHHVVSNTNDSHMVFLTRKLLGVPGVKTPNLVHLLSQKGLELKFHFEIIFRNENRKRNKRQVRAFKFRIQEM